MTEHAYRQARAQLLRSYCSQAVECRYWDEGAATWLGVPTFDGGDDRGVRCDEGQVVKSMPLVRPTTRRRHTN